jgi:hypothetical protein
VAIAFVQRALGNSLVQSVGVKLGVETEPYRTHKNTIRRTDRADIAAQATALTRV